MECSIEVFVPKLKLSSVLETLRCHHPVTPLHYHNDRDRTTISQKMSADYCEAPVKLPRVSITFCTQCELGGITASGEAKSTVFKVNGCYEPPISLKNYYLHSGRALAKLHFSQLQVCPTAHMEIANPNATQEESSR